jgi:hypothetical protein
VVFNDLPVLWVRSRWRTLPKRPIASNRMFFIGGGSGRDKTPTVAPSFLSHAVYFALINLLLILLSLLPILFDCRLVREVIEVLQIYLSFLW